MPRPNDDAPECCGERVDLLVAEASDGYRTWQLWRCPRCEAVHLTGWRPPVWINATARVCHALRVALDAAIREAYGG